MTDLSHAAQKIVNAAVESGGGYGRATPTLHAHLAAALRAAATMLRDAYANDENDFYVDPADDWLDDIAAELEAQ